MYAVRPCAPYLDSLGLPNIRGKKKDQQKRPKDVMSRQLAGQ